MRFEQLEFFVELAHSLSFTHACKNLHITRQALSASIKNLEQELNTKLLIRDVTGVTLTEKGFQLLDFAEDILNRQKEFYNVFFELDDEAEMEAELEIQISSRVYPFIYPEMFMYFYRNYPKINLNAESIFSTEQLIEDITAEIVIVPVVFEKEKIITEFPSDYDFFPLFECKPFVWISQKSPLNKQKFLDYTECSNYPLIEIVDLDKRADNLLACKKVFCETHNMNVAFSLDNLSVHMLENLVENDLGIRIDFSANNQSVFSFLEKNSHIRKKFIKYPKRIIAGYLLRKKETHSPVVSLLVNYLNKMYIN